MMSSLTVKFESDDVIDRLLDIEHVWQTIFEMLSVEDRIRLEMTNKRLCMLMLASWKRVTSFDMESITEISYSRSMSKKEHKKLSRAKRKAAFVASICIDRIGDSLRSLTIRDKLVPVATWRPNLPSIANGCPNVETINVFTDKKLDNIRFHSFSRLETIIVSSRYCISAWPSVFLSIPASIEVIRGLEADWKEPFENAAQLEGFFADRSSLREVHLGHLRTRDRSEAEIFRVIAERCQQLKSIKLSSSNCISRRGIDALESMKELRLPGIYFDEMEIVTICERSPLVEVLELELRFSFNFDLQQFNPSVALNSLGALTKLAALRIDSVDLLPPLFVTEFVRQLARNSGASLRRLHLGSYCMSLPTAAIEALANGCPKLRYLRFRVSVGEATPASIHYLIDCIVAHPSWIPHTDQPTLETEIDVWGPDAWPGGGDEHEVEAGRAAFSALAAPAANLPSGVQLKIWAH